MHMTTIRILSIAFYLCSCISLHEQSPTRARKKYHGQGRKKYHGPGPRPLRHKVETLVDINKFLKDFGYLDQAQDSSHRPKYEETLAALTQFQRYNHVNPTGNIDRSTRAKLNQKRCGLPDIIPPRRSGEPQQFNLGSKWKKVDLTYRIAGFTSQLENGQQRDAIRKAFDVWSKFTPLRFTESNSPSTDMVLKFDRGDHGDGYPFDGQGSVLAHAFFPENGNTHFDADELWTTFSNDATDLYTVAAHELGHSLGLAHSQVEGSLMAPYYQGYDPDFELHADDIKGIQALYGGRVQRHTTAIAPRTFAPRTRAPRTFAPRTRAPTTARPIPTTTTTPNLCDIHFDATLQGHDGYTYMFNGSNIYRVHRRGLVPGFPKHIREVFPKAPSPIDTAFYIPSTRKTYMIIGARLWRFTRFQLDAGYPRWLDTDRFPERPRAAILYNSQLFIFGESQFWEWDPNTEQTKGGYPLKSATYWIGVPNGLHSAMKWVDGYMYFFHESGYYKAWDRSILPGYPKDPGPAWIGGDCGSAPK